MFVSADGHKAWYSALELEQIAKDYTRQKNLAFEFEGAEKTFWVYTENIGQTLATVAFSHEVGKPYLQVEIDRFGKPMRYRTGTNDCAPGDKK